MRRVYFIHAPSVNLIKIGSSGEPELRLTKLRLLSPVPLILLGTIAGSYERETELHRQFSQLHSHGEWFFAAIELTRFINAELLMCAWNRAGPEAREIFLARIDKPVADDTSALRVVS